MGPLRPVGIGNLVLPGDVTSAALRGNRTGILLLERCARAEHREREEDEEPGGERKGTTTVHTDPP